MNVGTATAEEVPAVIERIVIERGFVIELLFNDPAHPLPLPQGQIGIHVGCGGQVWATILESKFLREIQCRECGRRREIPHSLETIGALWRQFPLRVERELEPGEDHHDV